MRLSPTVPGSALSLQTFATSTQTTPVSITLSPACSPWKPIESFVDIITRVLNSFGKALAHIAIGFGMIVLLFPTEAVASLPGETMYEPEQIELGSRRWGSFLNEGTDPNEPLTAGSGTSCPEIDGWTFDFTHWYYFWGTGESVVVRVDGAFDVGMAIYQEKPAVESLLLCRAW